jgi:pimeloyl-ACP methyl ester carboxylesterase
MGGRDNYLHDFSKASPGTGFIRIAFDMGGMAALCCFLKLADVVAALVVIRISVQFLAQIVGLLAIAQTRPDFQRPFKMWFYPLPALVATALSIHSFVARIGKSRQNMPW